jgi:hypothetical protein
MSDAHEIKELRAQLHDARGVWSRDVVFVLNQILNKASALGDALGEISHDEAVDALQEHAKHAIEAIR